MGIRLMLSLCTFTQLLIPVVAYSIAYVTHVVWLILMISNHWSDFWLCMMHQFCDLTGFHNIGEEKLDFLTSIH